MSVSAINLNAAITWALAKTNSGFTDTTQGQDSASFNASSLSTTTWNAVLTGYYTIASAGTQAVDFRTFTDLAGNSIASADKIIAVIVIVTGAVTDTLNVKKHATNGLLWFFENASYGINIPGGGFAMFSEGTASTGTTVDASNKQWLLTNNGAASLTVKLVALLSDV